MIHKRSSAATSGTGAGAACLSSIVPPCNRIAQAEPLPLALPAGSPLGSKRQRDLQACVATLLTSGPAVAVPVEKRAHRRFPFRKPLGVTPVDNATGRPEPLKNFPAFGIDISATGICFLGRQLVPARKAVLSIEGPDGQLIHVLFEPRWVRFTRGGWYQTGGRLLEVLSPDSESPPILRLLEPPPDIDELCENSRHSHRKPL